MHLYHFTALSASAATHACHGSFTAPRQQELVLACNGSLELFRLHSKAELLEPVLRAEAFAQIRALDVFRLPGTRRDFLVLTSDSGSIVILSADVATGSFKRVHCEPFGKSGARRSVPGAYLACEPHGRACMVAALEKTKFAYVLNRDAEENVTISSPLEAHKSACVTHALISLDVGFENPMFAALERTYEANSKKMLVYYELDLGLNQVVRKMTAEVRPESNLLLRVPGGTDGPGGVLVCSEGWVTYRNLLEEDENGTLLSLKTAKSTEQGAEHVDRLAAEGASAGRLEVRLPHRDGTSGDELMIVTGTAYLDRKANTFFFLLCSEHGDLVKAELVWDTEQGASALQLFYFDTLPGPAVGMCIFRSGYLVAAAVEGSDTLLLRFREVSVPSDDPAGGFSSTDGGSGLLAAADEHGEANGEKSISVPEKHANGGVGFSEDVEMQVASQLGGKLQFHARSLLSRLALRAVIDSFAPILGMCSLEGDGPGRSSSLICATGRSKCGSIRVVRRGMGVLEMSQPHQLASKVTEVFSCKDRTDSMFHRLMVVSFQTRTKVLKVGDGKLEETVNSGFVLDERTLTAGQMDEDSFVQVTKTAVRFIRGGDSGNVTEWKPPVPGIILAGCCNKQQVVVVLSTGAIVYFEIETSSGSLEERGKNPEALQWDEDVEFVGSHPAVDVGRPSVAIPAIPPGRRRSMFFAAGDGVSGKVRLFQIADEGAIEALGLHIAPAPIESIAFVDYGCIDKEAVASSMGSTRTLSNATTYSPLLVLVVGTRHGALVRLAVDALTGNLSDKRSKFIGEMPVHVKHIRIAGVPTCVVMGSSAWMLFLRGGQITTSPLCTDPMEHAAAFSLEHSPDGFVVTHGSKLRLLSLEGVSALITSSSLPHGIPMGAVPSSTILESSFTVSRSRTESTPRRVFRVARRRRKPTVDVRTSADMGSEEDKLAVVVETDYNSQHMDKQTPENGAGMQASEHPKQLYSSVWCPAKWNSRLQLVRIVDGDAKVDADEDDELDLDENPLLNSRPSSFEALHTLQMKDNECILTAVSSSALGRSKSEAVSYVVVSQAKNFTISGTSPTRRDRVGEGRSGGEDHATFSLLVYKVDTEAKQLVFVHKTSVAEPIHCMTAFRDMILVGIGGAIRLYDLGIQQLLRKGEFKVAVRNKVCALAVVGGDRVFVGDVKDSVGLFKYVSAERLEKAGGGLAGGGGGHFVRIAGDSVPRWVVSLEALDYNTVVGSDKFGNIFVLRVPAELGDLETCQVSRVGGHKLGVEACYHVGSIATGLVRGSMAVGKGGGAGEDEEAVVYSTMSGTIGVLAGLRTRSDIDFARALEREMRVRRAKGLCGREHTAFRSMFYPAKHVVDGDLCELFSGLGAEEREACAAALGRKAEDVDRKLTELRAAFV